MLEILPQSHDNILAVKGTGKLHRKDYEEVLIPRLEAMVKEHPRARFLFYMDKNFEGWGPRAAWHYARIGLKHRGRFEKIAAVCGPKWVHAGVKLQSLFVNGDVRTFPCEQAVEAWNWIEA